MAKKKRLDTFRVTKAFKATEAFAHMQQLGMAAFEPRLSGGNRALIESNPDFWQPLKPGTIETKRRKGQPTRPWVATGKTMQQLSQGPLTKMGANKGVTYRISSKGIAQIIPKKLNKRVPRNAKGRRTGKTVLFDVLQWGLAYRPLQWQAEDIQPMKRSIEKAMKEIFEKEGFK